MRRKTKFTLIALMCVLALIAPLFLTPTSVSVAATTNELVEVTPDVKQQEIVELVAIYESSELSGMPNTNPHMVLPDGYETSSVTGTIFLILVGVVVGWYADATVTILTGKSVPQHLANAFKAWVRVPGVVSVHADSPKGPTRAMNAEGCIKFHPTDSHWVCPY